MSSPRLRVLVLVGLTVYLVGYLLLLILGYGVFSGGTFNRAEAGPVSEWFGNFLTGLAILGLVYELSRVRLQRSDDTTREINSVLSRIEVLPWVRNGETPGDLVAIWVQNDGERKAMNVEVELRPRSGQLDPNWVVVEASGVAIPPNGEKEKRLLVAHLPHHSLGDPALVSDSFDVVVSWTDSWGRRIEMTNNTPSRVRARVTA